MTEIRYIAIRSFCEYHQIDRSLVEAFFEFGLLEAREERGEQYLTDEDIEPLETMLRLHTELGINLEGIEAIMHMRRRIRHLQQRLHELEYELKRRGRSG